MQMHSMCIAIQCKVQCKEKERKKEITLLTKKYFGITK